MVPWVPTGHVKENKWDACLREASKTGKFSKTACSLPWDSGRISFQENSAFLHKEFLDYSMPVH